MTISEVGEKYGITADTLRYYERIGMLPQVGRTPGGIRDYTPDDISWLELILCLRGAGLPIEAIIEYVKLFQMGDSTFPARLELLKEQRGMLLEQKEKIDSALIRLDYKISRYEQAVKTGSPEGDKPCTQPASGEAKC